MSSVEGALRDEIEGLRGQLERVRTETRAWRRRYVAMRDAFRAVEVVIDKSIAKPQMRVPPGWTESLPTDAGLAKKMEG